jgi:integrase
MSIKMVGKEEYLVQVQRGGIRRTRRGKGSESQARAIEAELVNELDLELKRQEAAALLGVSLEPSLPQQKPSAAQPQLTLRDFFERRWVEHAKVVQNPSTRRTSRCPFNYVLYYLGEKPLVDLLQAREVNAFVEAMKANGPIAFTTRQDGKARRTRCAELTNATINKSLQCLKALLNLAHREGELLAAPRIDLLPEDDSTTVIPPTEEEFLALLEASERFHSIAPLLREVIEFTAETGLRRGEVFALTWKSVDMRREALRVEMQARGRVVNGVAWKPKHNKWREVPLSEKAQAILLKRKEEATRLGEFTNEGQVFPNKGGAPYERMDRVEGVEGKGYFADAVQMAGLKGRVSFHGLRHLFAVRLLTRGVPITVVSELLGHSDINLTVKRYGRFSSDAKVKWDAVRVLDEVT